MKAFLYFLNLALCMHVCVYVCFHVNLFLTSLTKKINEIWKPQKHIPSF